MANPTNPTGEEEHTSLSAIGKFAEQVAREQGSAPAEDPPSESGESPDNPDETETDNPSEDEESAEAPSEEQWVVPGRYRTVDDVLAAKASSDAEARRLLEDHRREVDELKAQISQRASDDAVNQQKGRIAEIRKKLTEEGYPIDLIEVLQEETARQVVTTTLDPLLKAAQADGELMEEYGSDYATKRAQVMSWINRQPELRDRYQRMLSADPAGAVDWALMKFSTAQKDEAFRSAQAGGGGDPSSKRGKPQAKIAKPGSRTSKPKSETSRKDDEEVRRAWEEAMRTGNWEHYALKVAGRVPSLTTEGNPHLRRVTEDYGE